jgi:hypothetical protein
VVENLAHAFREEYGGLEKDLQVSLPGSAHDGHVPAVLSRESENKLLTLLRALPHGVIKFSHHVPGSIHIAVQRFSKLSKDSQSCPKILKAVQRFPKPSKDPQSCPKIPPNLSNDALSCPKIPKAGRPPTILLSVRPFRTLYGPHTTLLFV